MPKFLITKCLTWNELSPEQRAKIIDKNRDIRLDWLSNEEIIWDFSEAGNKIADAGFLNPAVYYNYSYSQGDGACFDCEIFNWELLLEDLDIPHKAFFIKYLEEGTNISYGIARPNASFAYHYSHEKCRRFYIDSQYGWPPRVCDIYAKIEAHIEQKRLAMSQEAFSLICKAIDWLQSDECITEELECRDDYYNEETLRVVDETKLIDNLCKGGKIMKTRIAKQEKFWTKGSQQLLISCLYALGDIDITLEKFDMNFIEDDEMRNYLTAIQDKVQQLEKLLMLTRNFAETGELELNNPLPKY